MTRITVAKGECIGSEIIDVTLKIFIKAPITSTQQSVIKVESII